MNRRDILCVCVWEISLIMEVSTVSVSSICEAYMYVSIVVTAGAVVKWARYEIANRHKIYGIN